MLYALGAVLVIGVLFVAWRYTSVARGARQRDERILRLLDYLGARLDHGEPVEREAVEELAAMPHVRGVLRDVLQAMGSAELFPDEFDTRQHYAEFLLAYWMMHRNELKDAPSEIELAEVVFRSVSGREAEFFVFRYRMVEGHWAGSDWLLGLAGPFFEDDVPYDGQAGGFALVDDYADQTTPFAVVDRYIDLVRGRVAWANA